MEESVDVICQFCQRKVPYISIRELEKIGVENHWCDVCRAAYLIWKDSDVPDSCSLYTIIKDKCYCWTTTATGRAALWYVKNPGELGKELTHDRELLFSMAPEDNQPKITPENVSQKIKTMLVFL